MAASAIWSAYYRISAWQGGIKLLPIYVTRKVLSISRLVARGIIERGFETFFEIGRAVAIIRDKRFYRAEFGLFEAYYRDKWATSCMPAHRLADPTNVIANWLSIRNIPATESQAHPLKS